MLIIEKSSFLEDFFSALEQNKILFIFYAECKECLERSEKLDSVLKAAAAEELPEQRRGRYLFLLHRLYVAEEALEAFRLVIYR